MEEKQNRKRSENFIPWSDNHQNVFIASDLRIDKESVLLNGEHETRIVVAKYMPLSRFVSNVKNKEFAFLSPLLWSDPFEMLFYNPKLHVETEDYYINACCFAGNDIQNEEGFWNVWGKGSNESIVRVTYDLTKLLETLSNRSPNGLSYYLGAMKYLPRDILLKIKAESMNKTYRSVTDYLGDCLLKRDAYSYEIELRLFAVSLIDKEEEALKIGEIDYSTGIVANVTLPPLEPLGNSHPSLMMYKCMQDCVNMSIKQKIENLIKDGKLKCEIYQSALYCTDIKERFY